MNRKKILVSGAGIAGPTLAYWLHKSGHDVTVIERAPKLRLGGQNIDVSDAAVDVVKMMGIEEEILRHNTTEIGVKFVNDRNEAQAVFRKGGSISFTSKYEILRGDLGELIAGLTLSKIPYRFGEVIERIEEHGDSVTAHFKSGSSESFDLIIAADGVSSSTRKHIVSDPDPYKYLGVYTSYMTIPRRESDEKWARWYNATKGRVILMRPDNKGTTRASVNYWTDAPDEAHFTREAALAKIRSVLSGAGWEADRIAHDLENDPDIYLGPVSQVRLSKWSRGRCALVGDAAYCPTPFTGMGTTIAVIGAYILAGELSLDDDHARAFRDYESKFRSFVEDIQNFIPGQYRLVYPQTRLGVRAFNTLVSVFASGPIEKLIARLSKKPRDAERKFKLPEYSFS